MQRTYSGKVQKSQYIYGTVYFRVIYFRREEERATVMTYNKPQTDEIGRVFTLQSSIFDNCYPSQINSRVDQLEAELNGTIYTSA